MVTLPDLWGSMAPRAIYEFDSFRVDLENRTLRRNDVLIPLTPKAFQTLAVLLENQDRVVDKRELLKLVWPDTYTEESNLAHQILAIRKALGEFHSGKHYIETIAKRGYRFVGNVKRVGAVTVGAVKEAGHSANISPEEQTATLIKPIARYSQHLPRKLLVPILAALALIVMGAAFKSRLLSSKAQYGIQAADLKKGAERNYREGRFFWQQRTELGYRNAISNFEQAVKLDPDYAEAYAGLADSYILLGSFGMEPSGEVIPKARAAALRAIEIDERSAEAHASMGYIMSRFDWNWDEAEREFRQAVELDPGYTTAHQWYALHLITVGRPAEALIQMRTAQKLEPTSPILNTDTALVLFYARRYDDALEECRRVLRVDASFGLAHRTLGAIYAAKGMYWEALTEFAAASKLLGTDPWIVAETGRSYAMLGNREQALLEFEELQELSKHRYVSPSAFALLSAALEDKRDESFQWLEKEYDQHSNLAILTVHPGFDPIRHDPRFQSLLKRIGLSQDQGF